MPSPIAHSITGYALSRLPFTKSNLLRSTPLLTAYAVFVACSPDLDFIPEKITGLTLHRGPSHSLLAAFLVSGLLAWMLNYYYRAIHKTSRKASFQLPYKAIFTFTLWLYLSHLVLDLLTQGSSGLPLLWPITIQRFQLPFTLFPPVHHSRGLFDPSHFVFLISELFYVVIVTIGLYLYEPSRSDNSNSPS